MGFNPISAIVGIGASLLGGGSKGGKTTEQKMPEWQEKAWKENIEAQKALNNIGYMPNYAPTRAKFNPLLKQAVNNTQKASQAFGMSSPTNVLDNMTNTTFADRMIKDLGMGELMNVNGIEGYSSGNLLDASKQMLGEKNPDQLSAYEKLFSLDKQDSETTGEAGDYAKFINAYMKAYNYTGNVTEDDALKAWQVYKETGYADPYVLNMLESDIPMTYRGLGIGME